jgi:mannose-6-phosphate isomerase-like protein (cupin superfamily)
MNLIEGLTSLIEESQYYIEQLTSEEKVYIEITLTDSNETATLIIHKGLSVKKGKHNSDLRLKMKKEIFEKILSGEADFGANIGRSKISDKRPIDFEIINKEKTIQILNTIYTLMNVFFTPGKIKIKKMNKELAGDAHGAHPIPIVYWNGLRQAWYSIEKAETLNEAGEKDPYPQTFMIIKGRGIAYIGDEEIEISPSEVIYIPANETHSIKAYEDIELLWTAWKAPLI